MKVKIRNKILALLILPIFIVSISGWTLFIHHCTHCQSNTLSILQENLQDCCEKPHHHLHNGLETCCHQEKDDDGCCSHKSVQFKVKSDFDRDSSPSINPIFSLPSYQIIHNYLKDYCLGKDKTVNVFYSPPLRPTLGSIMLALRL